MCKYLLTEIASTLLIRMGDDATQEFIEVIDDIFESWMDDKICDCMDDEKAGPFFMMLSQLGGAVREAWVNDNTDIGVTRCSIDDQWKLASGKR